MGRSGNWADLAAGRQAGSDYPLLPPMELTWYLVGREVPCGTREEQGNRMQWVGVTCMGARYA